MRDTNYRCTKHSWWNIPIKSSYCTQHVYKQQGMWIWDMLNPHAIASFELGANSRVGKHASHVAEFVYQFLSPWYRGPLLPDKLLVIITGVLDDAIEEAIREAAGRVVHKVQIFASKSEFIASRGSAELALRVNIMEFP